MKLIFFLIGFTLIFLRVYVGWSGIFKSDPNSVTITRSDGSNYTQLKYAGKIVLTDDETAFQSIAPGGYVKFTKNEQKMVAEGTLKGTIQYELSDDGSSMPYDENGKQFVAGAIREMIAFGFDADARLERVYQSGGNKALLHELKQLRSATVSNRYARRLIQTDTLNIPELTEVIDAISTFYPDHEKVDLLNQLPFTRLLDSNTVEHYVAAIGTMRGDVDKMQVLNQVIDKDTLTVTGWIRLIQLTATLKSDIDKSNTLIRMAQHMPYSEPVKEAYLKTARTIHAEVDYNKAIQAIP
jgi:hypothetical protein